MPRNTKPKRNRGEEYVRKVTGRVFNPHDATHEKLKEGFNDGYKAGYEAAMKVAWRPDYQPNFDMDAL